MSSLAEILGAISELLLGPAEYLARRQPDPDPREMLVGFLDDLVIRHAGEGLRHASNPLVIMLQDSSLTARIVDDASSIGMKAKAASADVERIATGPGWAFVIESGSRTTIERLTQILDAELEDLR